MSTSPSTSCPDDASPRRTSSRHAQLPRPQPTVAATQPTPRGIADPNKRPRTRALTSRPWGLSQVASALGARERAQIRGLGAAASVCLEDDYSTRHDRLQDRCVAVERSRQARALAGPTSAMRATAPLRRLGACGHRATAPAERCDRPVGAPRPLTLIRRDAPCPGAPATLPVGTHCFNDPRGTRVTTPPIGGATSRDPYACWGCPSTRFLELRAHGWSEGRRGRSGCLLLWWSGRVL